VLLNDLQLVSAGFGSDASWLGLWHWLWLAHDAFQGRALDFHTDVRKRASIPRETCTAIPIVVWPPAPLFASSVIHVCRLT